MTLADTSAWIEFLRDRSSSIADSLGALIVAGDLALCEPVAMEALAGATSRAEARRIQRLLALCQFLPVGSVRTWENAAALYRACRTRGVTPRSHVDCLIAAVAIREDVPVLHYDRDFDLIAEHTPLRVAVAD